MNIQKRLEENTVRVNRALESRLPPVSAFPAHLHEAIRYSIFAGGKRVRPFLVIEAARLAGGQPRKAYALACAVEMIHTYSLIHDDLPSMDNDLTRRGKKTCHIAFDEATAILAGDALLSHAFDVIVAGKGISSRRKMEVVRVISRAIGPYGMVAGQAADIRQKDNKDLGLAEMNRINGFKTGELITACVEAGAIWGGAHAGQVQKAQKYGRSIGFLFQVVDDIIDGDGYARMAGNPAAYRKAVRLRDEAKNYLKIFGTRGSVLSQFADFLYERKA